jgi:hypothetical protein
VASFNCIMKGISMPRLARVVVCLASVFSTFTSFAQQLPTTSVPNLIRYSGTLKDAQGAVSSGTPLGVTFAIYKQQDGGAPIWQETQNVTVEAGGNYSVLLGSTTAPGLPDNLFSQQEQRWLGVQVQEQAEQPRVLLVSVPYAFKAQEAETLGGLPPSAFVKAPSSDAPGGTQGAGGGPDTIVNCTNAQNGRISVFTQSAPPNITLCNSGIYEAKPYGTGAIGILNPNPIAALDVTGDINTSQYYQIGGSTVLSIPGVGNLFVGPSAGANNTGNNNTFVGFQAGQNNTTGSNDLYISNAGPASGTESNAIRIGSSQAAAYMAGVYGAATSSGSALFVDSTGKLGTGGGSGLVTSFNGRSGAVVPASGDYSFSLLSGTLASSQLAGTYSNAITLSNSSNSLSGNGSGLTGVNASSLGGLPAASYAVVTGSNTFNGDQTISAPDQSGLLVQGPFSGFGAGIDLSTTGSGGKKWEMLATGSLAAQGSGKLNFRDAKSSPVDVLTLTDTGVGILNTKPAAGLDINANDQSGLLVQGPYSLVGAGIDLKTTGSGGKQWEMLATGFGASQGAGKLNFRDINTGQDILTMTDTGVGIANTQPGAVLDVYGGFNGSTAKAAIITATGQCDQGYGLCPVALYIPATAQCNQYTTDCIHSIRVENDVSGLIFDASALGVYIGQALIVEPGSPTLADAWTTRSSRRFKTDIQPLAGALQKVKQMQGVSYKRKSDGKQEIGVIAEDVAQVVPEVVFRNSKSQEVEGLDYSRLTALLIEAVKTQQSEIQDLRKQVKQLKRNLAKH